MPTPPEYAILGNGRWAGIVARILTQQAKVTIIPETRVLAGESDDAYQARMSSLLAGTGAQIAWICVPPNPHTLPMAAAAIDHGMHVIAEKPWVWGGAASRDLVALAQSRGVLVGVHYEYCLLDELQDWRSRFGGAGLRFHGSFSTSRPNRLRLPAIENLGSHLFAIRAHAVPDTAIATIDCRYDHVDERIVSLTDGARTVARIDFSTNREPIIQRFLQQFESGIRGGPFPFTLNFAATVWESLTAFRTQE
jgi:hypothetical protein